MALRGQGELARLMAYVVLAGAPAADWELAIRAALARRLPAHMVPSAILALPELPLRSSGKVDESALPDRAPTAPLQPMPPLHGYRRAMAALWSEVLECGPVGEGDDFFARGGHSLLTLKLMARVRAQFGIAAPLRLLLSEPVLGPFADAVLRMGAGLDLSESGPLAQGRPGHPPVPGAWRRWRTGVCAASCRRIGAGFPVYGFAAPGLQDGETALASVPGLAARHLEALRTIQPQGPYRLGGWSAGGMIAYEMARQLEADDERVELLFMIDTPRYALLDAASQPAVPAFDRAGQLAQLRLLTGGEADAADVPAVPDSDDIEAWLARGRAAGWLHADAGLEEAERVLAVRLGLARAIHSYRRAPPRCPVVLVVAAERSERAGRQLGWESGPDSPPEWRVIESPGNHMSMVSAVHAPALANALSSFLFSLSPLMEFAS